MIPVPARIQVSYLSRKQIEREAEVLLHGFFASKGSSLQIPVPVDDILELYLQVRLEFCDVKSLTANPDALGATIFWDGKVVIDQLLDPESGGHLGQYRFTVAHEIGHWALHLKYFLRPDNEELPFERIPQPDFVCTSFLRDRPEFQANYFAADLLMPRPLIYEAARETLTEEMEPETLISVMAEQFEVSKQAMAIRLSEMKVILPNLGQEKLSL